MAGTLETAIAKYGGDDEAYKLKLKNHIREGMGYSNYVNRIKGETSGAAGIGDIKGLSPQGIKSRIASRFGDQNKDISSLRGMAGAVDTAAGGIAANQIAEGKAAAAKKASATGFENDVAFSPQNELEQKILSYMQNPKNPDGSVKSLQQFESEIDQYYKENIPGGGLSPTDRPIFSTEEINKTIAAKVPKDFIGNEDKYHFMAQGYSQKQADTLQGGLRYDTMSEPEKLIYQVQNPSMAKLIDEGTVNKELLSDIGTTTDPKTGETTPNYTFGELKEKYPQVQEATLKELVAPAERAAIQDDVRKWFTGDIMEAGIKKIKDDGYDPFMATPEYKELKTKLTMEYSGVFTAGEIETLIYKTIMSQ